MRNSIRSFDRIVGKRVAMLPHSARLFMEFFTLIGQPPFTVGIAAAVLGYGWALEKQVYIDAGIIAIITLVISSLLKLFLHRKRPVNDYVRGMFFHTFSFPSGHAAGSLVSFGLAAVVLSQRWPEYIVIFWAIALVSVFFVSLSRVYLGAHYASDIVGGWLTGGAGLFLIVLLFI